MFILVTHPRKSEISLEDPARIPLIVPKSSGGPLLRICKAAEGGTSRNPPQLSGERRGAASGSFGGAVQNIVVRFRRPKHLFHMLRGGARLGPEVLTSSRHAATGAQSTNPATLPPAREVVFAPFRILFKLPSALIPQRFPRTRRCFCAFPYSVQVAFTQSESKPLCASRRPRDGVFCCAASKP